ncbi:hypothetical protein CBL_20186 [Carabus blaptoides fortunei]
MEGLGTKLTPISKNRLITSISGQALPVVGTAAIEISFAHKNITHEFVVCDDYLALSTEGLIGTDFLSKHEAEISYARNEVIIGCDKIKIASVNDETAETTDNEHKQIINVIDQPVRDNTKDPVKDLADKPSVDVSMNSVRTKGYLIISPRSEIICTGTGENPQSNTGYEEAVSVANRKSDYTGNHRVMNVNEFDIATQFQAKHLKPTEMKTRLQKAYEVVRDRLRRVHERNKAQYNKKTAPVSFKVGDRVFLRDFTTSPVNFVITDPKTGKQSVVHANRLKLCLTDIPEDREEQPATPIPAVPRDSELYHDYFDLPPIPAHLRPTDLKPPDPNVSDPDTSDHVSDDSDETEVSATHTEVDSDERFTDNNEPDNEQFRYLTRSCGRPPDQPWISNSRI